MRPTPEELVTVDYLGRLARRVLEACHTRGWAVDWSRRGAYLFLEAAEFIESLRGKGKSPPEEEAADVLTVLLSTFAAFDLDLHAVLRHLHRKLTAIEAGNIGDGPDAGPQP